MSAGDLHTKYYYTEKKIALWWFQQVSPCQIECITILFYVTDVRSRGYCEACYKLYHKLSHFLSTTTI